MNQVSFGVMFRVKFSYTFVILPLNYSTLADFAEKLN